MHAYALLLASVLPLATPAPAPMTAEKVTARVQKIYDGTTDFSASFTQDYRLVALGRSQQSTGTVAYRKPGKIRFDYQSPNAKTYAVDGTTLWVFQAADHQALVDRCFKADGLTASLVFLGGSARILEQFNVELAPSDAGFHGLKLIPKTPQGGFRSITLLVDQTSFEVAGTVVEDMSGNANKFTFTNVRRNKGVKAEAVTFAPPPGVGVSPVPGSCNTPPPMQ